jgi:hypothetical protein
MTYVPGIDRFLLTYSTDEVPHTFNTPPEVAKETWVQRTELVVLEGRTPWGAVATRPRRTLLGVPPHPISAADPWEVAR